MTILLKKAVILDPGNKLHNKTKDILIKNGKFVKIAAKISDSNAKVISSKNLHVSQGWVDMRVNFQEPGYEYKEGIDNGLKTASSGGFTGVVSMPTTYPAVDNVSAVQYLKSRSSASACEIFPAGSISQGLRGEKLSEFHDMTQSGAVAFTEDTHFNTNSSLLSKALEYGKTIDGLVYSFPYDSNLAAGGQMHEGKTSTISGMKGIPSVSEEIQLARDIQLLKHFGGRLHVVAISTANAVQQIRDAKKEGLNITCSIHAHQMCFTDKDVVDFDSRFKVLPPFRSELDNKALLNGLKDGTIDAICSGHEPEGIEEKKREFTEAEFGISSLETAYSALQTSLGSSFKPEDVAVKFSTNPKQILGLEINEMSEGNPANITLFDPNTQWTFKRANMISKSKSTPFNNNEFTGRVIGIINRGKSAFNAL